MALPRIRPLALAMALATAGSLGSPPRARAQPTAAEVAIAEGLFKTARELMDAGRAAEACPKLAESQRIDPRLGTLLNLAACHELEGKTASAWAEYGDAAVRAERAGQHDRAKLARDQAAKLDARLSRLVVRVAPADAPEVELRIDGARLGAASLDVPIPVDPGQRTIEIRAPGKRPWSTSVLVQPGPATASVVVPPLERDAPAAANAPPPSTTAAVPPAPATPTDGGNGLAIGAVSAFAVGLGSLAVGSVFGVQAISTESDADVICPGRVCSSKEGIDQHDSAARDGTISTVFFAVGVVAVAVGATLLLTAPSKAPKTGTEIGDPVPRGVVLVMPTSAWRFGVLFAAPSLVACNALIGLEDHVLGDAGASTSGAGGCVDVQYKVEQDEDDAMWNRSMIPPHELLAHDGGIAGIYVGSDADQECAAVRFAIDAPGGAQISSATLTLWRMSGNNMVGDTLRIDVWDPPDLAPFDGAHIHGPEDHGPAGLGAPSVQGWKPGVTQDVQVAVEVTELVKHLVEHADYVAGQHVGFLLRPLVMEDRHVAFMDSSITTATPQPASLVVSYCPP